MKSMTQPLENSIKMTSVVLLGFGIVFLARGDEEKNARRMFDEFEQAMLQQIERIHATCDVSELYKAKDLKMFPADIARTPLDSIERKISAQMKKEGRLFALNLKLLQAVIAAHDPGYDINNPPPRPAEVIPPPPFRYRDDPETIEDPVIREKYKKYREECNQHYVKHQREKELQSLRRSLIFSLKTELCTIKYLNPSKLPYVLSLLDEAIADKEIKQAILEDVNRPPEKVIYPPVENYREFLSRVPPEQRGQFLEKAKKESNYTDEELKALEAPFE